MSDPTLVMRAGDDRNVLIRNADGSWSAWSRADAVTLHTALGRLLKDADVHATVAGRVA